MNKIDKLFSLSPSFYAILSGALISIGINLLTSLFFDQEATINRTFLILAIIFLLISSVPLISVSLVLEELRSKAEVKGKLLRMLKDRRTTLWPLTSSGFASIIAGVVFLYFAMNP